MAPHGVGQKREHLVVRPGGWRSCWRTRAPMRVEAAPSLRAARQGAVTSRRGRVPNRDGAARQRTRCSAPTGARSRGGLCRTRTVGPALRTPTCDRSCRPRTPLLATQRGTRVDPYPRRRGTAQPTGPWLRIAPRGGSVLPAAKGPRATRGASSRTVDSSTPRTTRDCGAAPRSRASTSSNSAAASPTTRRSSAEVPVTDSHTHASSSISSNCACAISPSGSTRSSATPPTRSPCTSSTSSCATSSSCDTAGRSR